MKGTLSVIGICLLIAGLGYAAPAAVNSVFNVLDFGLGWLGSLTVVTLVSAITGVLFIVAFPHVSAQGAIVAVKDRIKHNLLGIRIFQDDMPTVGKGVFGSLSWNFAYLGLNILPMIVLAAPFMVVWFQLNALYAYEPFQEGERHVIVAELQAGVPPQEVSLQVPSGLTLVNRANLDGKVAFTLETSAAGAHEISLTHGGTTVTKTVEVGTDPQRLARLRTADPFGEFVAAHDPILFFADPVLPKDSFLRTITIPYAASPLGPFGGGEITIMLIFIVVSMAVGFGLKGFFGVEI
jgi:hypothetical protein